MKGANIVDAEVLTRFVDSLIKRGREGGTTESILKKVKAEIKRIQVPSVASRANQGRQARVQLFYKTIIPTFIELQKQGYKTPYAITRKLNEMKVPSFQGGIWYEKQARVICEEIAKLPDNGASLESSLPSQARKTVNDGYFIKDF